MILSYPIALWALAGLAVPLLIHLLSHDRGRRLPFASVRFIPGFRSQRMRSPSLSRWLLFLLRCLLLIVLALLMARPLLQDRSSLGGPVAVLVSPLALADGKSNTLALARQIAAQNNTDLRVLAPGFPLPGKDLESYPGGAWSLLAELERQIESETSILVLIADDPREKTVRKPSFVHSVEFTAITRGAPSSPKAPLRIAISASPGRQSDQVYLEAALDALSDSGQALKHDALALGDQTLDYDVSIVLSEDQCPQPARGQLVICDAAVMPLQSGARQSLIFDHAGRPFDLKPGPDTGTGGETLLAARDGTIIASLQRSGPGSLLRWNSRFNPEHAAVVGSWHFPALLKNLIWSNRWSPNPFDGQAQIPAEHRIEYWLTGLLLLLWLMERWLSSRDHGKQ